MLDSLLWTEKKTKHWSHCTLVKTYFKCWQTLHKRKPMKFNFKNGARLGSKPECVGGGREEEVVVGDQGKGLSRVGNKVYLTKFISGYHWLKVKVNNMLDDFEHLFKCIIVSHLRNIFTLVDYYKKTWHFTWFLIR